MVVPSCAVTTTGILFEPTLSVMAPEAWPDVTAVPFTVTVAVGSATVGVTVNEVIELITFSVIVDGTVVPCANPALVFTEARLLLYDWASVIVMLYVFWVLPSCAVTTTETVLVPTTSGTAVGWPDVAVLPLIFKVAPLKFVVGVIVMLDNP